MSDKESLRKTESRISTLEGRIGFLVKEGEEIRKGIVLLVDKIQAVLAKRLNETAIRKSLDIGDEYGPGSPGESLEGAVLSRLLHPQNISNNGHNSED